MNKILEKIYNLQTTLALSKLRDILIEEYSKGYYGNAANVKEHINLIEPYKREDGYTHYEHLILYRNGMYEFNNVNVRLWGIPIPKPQPAPYKKSKTKV